MRVRLYAALLAVAMALAAALLPSGTPASAQLFSVVVTTEALNLRSAPSTSARIVAVLARGDVVAVFDQVSGREVFPGNDTWYRTRSGNFIYSGLTGVAMSRAEVAGVRSGRRIEVDLSEQVARAVENGRVVHEALVTAGRPEFPTPVGNFRILRRVANETMDSRTIGIPLDSPDGYFLTGVLFTQYFTEDGTALHYNYWSPPEAFGSRPGSHGCVGLRLEDARFFWNFAGVGTPVIIGP